MYWRTFLFTLGVVCLAAASQDEAPDCNMGLTALIADVNKPNVTAADCLRAREAVQILLMNCESPDQANYVLITIDFVRHYADGEVCAGTKGPVTDCHDVPKCYDMIISDDNKYDCGENNEKVANSIKCFQEQIDVGCVTIGKRIKKFNEAAAKKYCGYEVKSEDNSSSATTTLTSAVIIVFSFLVTFI
ncbi:uncharacterized protein [Watersipora subatra]|uniref:uncharacterized protein n=1 Tax=Watersipora subatra TaxID=2589382 RepID=UPI00355C20C0